jgi:hypothetical protein
MIVLLLFGTNSFSQTITIQSMADVPEGAVSAELSLTGFGNQVSAFQWTITYDPAVLTFTGASNWFTGVGGVGVLTPESGKITFVWGDNPVAIEGVLCKLNFTTTGQGCSDLTWSDNPTPRLVADGTVNYNEYSVSYVNGKICGVITVPDNLLINSSLTDSDDKCFDAIDTITIAGQGNQVLFVAGSRANIIAGRLIRFLPGFYAEPGSYMDATITIDGAFCSGSIQPGIVKADQVVEKSIRIDGEVFDVSNMFPEIGIKVYPNPNDGRFFIKFSFLQQKATIKVYNILGILIHQSILNESDYSRIELPNQNHGIYFIKIITDDKLFSEKIIVE